MKKVLVVITSDLYVRNYLRTGALSALGKAFDVHVIADAKIKNQQDLEGLENFRGYFSLPERLRRLHEFHFNLMMWRNRKRSRTFTYRWLRNSGWHTVARVGSPGKRTLSMLKWFLGALFNPGGLRIPVLGNPLIFPTASFILRKKLPISPEVRHLTMANKYDLILFPSSAFEASTVDLIRLGKESGTPTLCLIDNWDNLTSKTVFWQLPDYLGVWGLQAKNQAVEIHGFKPGRVVPIGTPRFDPYFRSRSEELPKPFGANYILFVGSAMPFDELGVLRKLELMLGELEVHSDSIEIIYRPHPWQQKRAVNAVFDEDSFSRVKLDPQIAHAYQNGLSPETTDEKFQPDLNYYPALLRHAKLVIGPLTTMLLEAALLLRPVIGLSYFDGFHSNTSLRYFSHFEGTEKIPGFHLCEDERVLPELVNRALQQSSISEAESDRATGFFVYRDSLSYPQRLAELVREIIEE